jgi:diacylglycerol O-acyltransferase / wax synthase
VVTNVPGPQFPLYLLGRRLKVLFPVVPLARRQALGIAVMSYDGHLGFGLLGDYDALPELEAIAVDLKWAIASLTRAAGKGKPTAGRRASRNGAKSNGAKPKAAKAKNASARPRAAKSAGASRNSHS